MDIKRTGSFSFVEHQLRQVREDKGRAHAGVVAGLSDPAALLDASGIVVTANRALAEMLREESANLASEPMLTWIARAGDREAFGREFRGLARRSVGAAFVRELEVRPATGPALMLRVRACRLETGMVLVTFTRAEAADAETELGRAVTRALDGLDQGVFLLDGEGRIVHANPGAQSLLGDTVVGRRLLELAEPQSQDEVARGLTLARAGNWYAELDLVRPDGERIPVELSVAAGSGEGAPAVVLCRDLRELRRRQFETRLNAQVDRALIASSEPREAITSACAAIVTGMSARRAVLLTHFGGQWERWSVEPDAPPQHQALDSGLHPPSAWARKEGIETFDEVGGELAALFGSERGGARAIRTTLRAPGGVVGHLLLSRAPALPWEQEDLELFSKLASQVALGLANGLLMLETRALAAYQARVLDQSAVLLDSVDEEGRVVTWNRASERLVGMSAEEATGKRFGIEVARAADPQLWDEIWALLLNDGVFAREVVLLDADGDEVPIHLEGRVLRDGPHMRGAVLVGLDLRVRRALETQVARSQKMAAVGLLAAGIAHEINNPLSGVVGYSKMLLEKELEPRVREKVERIAQSGERCRKIVEGVLLFSRSQESGERRTVDLRALIDRVVRVGEYQWKMHNVRIVREANDQVSILADADQLEQVLLNLLSNAVDAMPRGGSVRISLRRNPDDGASLSVSDEGMGIPEEIRDSIFDPFFSTKEIGKGTGLGLSISYGIVRDHGGDILLESVPGRGTTFTITLPPEPPPSEPSESEARPTDS